jgi:hypothetical protein
MDARRASRVLLLVWAIVLASPIAWAISLATMFWLTHPVCQGLSRSVLTLAGSACALVAFAAAILAERKLKDLPKRDAEDSAHVLVFLLRVAFWAGLIFGLVIVLSLIPTALLTPCPV